MLNRTSACTSTIKSLQTLTRRPAPQCDFLACDACRYVGKMKYELKISYKDFKLAQRLHLRPRRRSRMVLYPLLALFMLAVICSGISFMQGNGSGSGFYILFGCMVYLFAIFFILVPLKWKRIFRQQKFLETTFEQEFTEAALCSASELGNVSLPWNKFHKWKENKSMFIVYQSDALFHLIPKRIFQTEEETTRLRMILSQSIGKAVTYRDRAPHR